jgi:hypothetical protein
LEWHSHLAPKSAGQDPHAARQYEPADSFDIPSCIDASVANQTEPWFTLQGKETLDFLYQARIDDFSIASTLRLPFTALQSFLAACNEALHPWCMTSVLAL